tara:strand:- start:6841 stop:7638 length:798 start_codon:yes stop_codon:yes gene_type:complete
MVLIGLGTAGCNIVEKFNDSYKKITINTGSKIPEFSSPEEYEEHLPDLSDVLDFTEEECWFFVCGAGKIASASLRALEYIKDKKINIVYIYPEEILLSPKQKKMNRVVYNVLQEYTRSGLLNSMWLFANEDISKFVPSLTMENMWDKINEAIVNALENIFYFRKTNPFMGSHHEEKEISRIMTVEYGSFENNEKKLYFPLDNITESCYINIVSDEEMRNNNNLMNIFKQKILDDIDKKIISSFTIFKTEYGESFYYAIHFTHFIQ